MSSRPAGAPHRPGRPSRATPGRVGAAVVAGLATATLLTSCASPQERFCDAVEEHQAELTRIASQEGADAVLDLLGPYRELADEAPDDVAPDWRTVVRAIEGLEGALAAADVDPSTYSFDPADPPSGTTRAERQTIQRAALRLQDPQVKRAQASIEQHALDVCGTPLAR